MLKALQLFLLPFILTVAKAGHQGGGVINGKKYQTGSARASENL